MEELNRYLSNLSEHHDMYVSPYAFAFHKVECRNDAVGLVLMLTLTLSTGRGLDQANRIHHLLSDGVLTVII